MCYCVFILCNCPGHQTKPFYTLLICLSNLQKRVCPEQLNHVSAPENGDLIWHLWAYKHEVTFTLLFLHLTYKH